MITSLCIFLASLAGFITGYCFGLRRKIYTTAPLPHKLGRQTFIRKA